MKKIIDSNLDGYKEMVKKLEKNRDLIFSTKSIVDKYRRYIDELR